MKILPFLLLAGAVALLVFLTIKASEDLARYRSMSDL